MSNPDSDLLVELLQKLDAGAHRRHELNLYYRAEQPMAFLSAEARAALDRKFGRVAANIPRLAVTSLAERLRISGVEGEPDSWQDFLANDLDQLSAVAHRESLALGQSFVIVWADNSGAPRATVESAEQVAVKRDPVTREVVAAVKRVKTKTTTEAWLYQPDEVQHWRSNSPGAASAGFDLVESIPNPLGVVPVVPLTNSDRLLDEDGRSEIEDLKPLVDGLCKTLADLAVAQEYTARPRRWATGIELIEVPRLDDDGNAVTDPDTGDPVMDIVNPIPDGNRAMISEEPGAKFGQLPGADLAGFKTAVDVWVQMIMAVSALPAHMIGITTSNPATAEAIRAAEASLTARAEARQLTFGRAWELVARLMVAVRTGVDPANATIRVVWADASTRSVAAAGDFAVKMYQTGIYSRETTLAYLGMSADQIAQEMARTQRDAQLGADVRLGRYLAGQSDPS